MSEKRKRPGIALWAAAVLAMGAVLVGYPLSWGPALRLQASGCWPASLIWADHVYDPLRWILERTPESTYDAVESYLRWAGPDDAPDGVLPEVQFPSTGNDLIQIDRLADVRSVTEIDSILEGLIPTRRGQANVERLLDGWGRHGSWYDLAVVHYLWDHWPSAYERWDRIEPAPLMSVVTARIRNNPDLLRQAFWYATWKSSRLEFADLCRCCQSAPNGCVYVAGQEFRLILLIGGAINAPELIDHSSPRSAGDDWTISRLYFLSKRPFLRFDRERGAYTVDVDAEREGRYLNAEEQRSQIPTTPLPDWDSDVVPARPEYD